MSKVRQKMPQVQRAKQFMPFAALKGLDTALRQAEYEAAKTQRSLKNKPKTDACDQPIFRQNDANQTEDG